MNACCFGSFPRQQADSLPEVRRPSKTNFENIFANFSEIGGCALRTLPVLYFLADADVAQLVEHDLAKVGVAGSNPVVRSIVANRPVIIKSFDRPFHDGVDEMATWPSGKAEACKAFMPQFKSGWCLQCPKGVSLWDFYFYLFTLHSSLKSAFVPLEVISNSEK